MGEICLWCGEEFKDGEYLRQTALVKRIEHEDTVADFRRIGHYSYVHLACGEESLVGESSSSENSKSETRQKPAAEDAGCEEPPKNLLATAATVWSHPTDSRKGEGLDIRATEWGLKDHNLSVQDELVRRQEVLALMEQLEAEHGTRAEKIHKAWNQLKDIVQRKDGEVGSG